MSLYKQTNIIAMLPLDDKQERLIERLYRGGHSDWNIGLQLEPHDRERRAQRELQVTRYLDRQFPQYRKKNLQGA